MNKEKVIEMINTGKSLAEKYPRLDVSTDDLNHVLKIYEGNIYKTPKALYYMGVAIGAITAKEKLEGG